MNDDASGMEAFWAASEAVVTSACGAKTPTDPVASASVTVADEGERPSWQSNSVAQAGTKSVYIDPASTLDVDIPLYNFGFVTTQSRLDADAWSTPVGSPVQLIAALPTGIGSTPGVIRVRVNSAGLPSGLTTVNATLQTSDENIPGAGATTL